MNFYIIAFNLFIFNITILINYSLSYIIYPFKTRKNQIENIENNITLLFRYLLGNNIFINMEISNPKQTIDVFLRTDSEILFFSEKNKLDLNQNYTNPQIYDVNSDLNNFFDKNKSSSLLITDKIATIFNNKGYYSRDIFYFNKGKENFKINASFALLKNTKGNMPGVFGLKAVKYQEYRNYNLIEQLKSNDIINSYFWMINYTTDYEGNLIIGEEPHNFDPINYKKENLRISYPFLHKTMEQWGLKFNEVLFGDKNFESVHECYFKYENNYIKGTPGLEKELDKYFNESILNGSCFKKYIQYPFPPHIFYYCDYEKYKQNIKFFPTFKFFHQELNYTFELNYKDLFIKKFDKLILMIFFSEIGVSWHLGKPFLRKYSFLINHDSKTVGFYIKNNYNNKNYNKNNIIYKIIIIILCLIILLLLGIFIGKLINNEKKRPLNIIEDDFEYKNDDCFLQNEIN